MFRPHKIVAQQFGKVMQQKSGYTTKKFKRMLTTMEKNLNVLDKVMQPSKHVCTTF
jgi:hypothetical protein